MRLGCAIVVIGLCCGCAGPDTVDLKGPAEPYSELTKRETIDLLAGQSDVVAIGTITGIRDATARDAGIAYDVVLETVLCGDILSQVLRFRSAGQSGYARYRMDEPVLLFLQRRDGELVQLRPICYVAGKPTPESLDLRPLSQYRSYVDEAVENRLAK